jgi:hypothetical protein
MPCHGPQTARGAIFRPGGRPGSLERLGRSWALLGAILGSRCLNTDQTSTSALGAKFNIGINGALGTLPANQDSGGPP